MTELLNAREELKKAKERSIQSWLDSKPLLDELEQQKSNLESTKNKSTTSKQVISDLQSQLESIKSSIKSKRESTFKARGLMNETSQAIDETKQELEIKKIDLDNEERRRSKVEEILKLKRQSLRALEMKIRAVRIESEAFGKSMDNALSWIEFLEKESDSTISVTHEEYFDLMRRAEEEKMVRDWRVAVSMGEKVEAEARRDVNLARSEKLRSMRRSRAKRSKVGSKREEEKIGEYGDGENGVEEGEILNNIRNSTTTTTTLLEAQGMLLGRASSKRNSPKMVRRSTSNGKKKKKKKKKASILGQIKSFLIRNITRLFR